MIGERWQTISINDAYEVSNLGRVRRIESYRILRIRKLSEQGVRRKMLAEQFSVSKQQIKNVVLRRSWASAESP